MRIALVGLGRMGANMARRLRRRGIEVVGYNRSPEIVEILAREEGVIPAPSLVAAVQHLTSPRVVWLMLPSGEPTEQHILSVSDLLEPGDIIVDGGNANYHDTQRRAMLLSQTGISLIDAGTSGGVWGLENGYCLMVGGDEGAVKTLEPVLKALAPHPDHGWARVGPVGSGHYTKMIHNGIEYGMMQAMAEGFALLEGKEGFQLDLGQIAELWRHGSVVRSWLLDLTAEGLASNPDLSRFTSYVADSGEGRWTVAEAVEQGIPLPVITLALQMRFASQDQAGYQGKLLSMMRNAFGGHAIVNK